MTQLSSFQPLPRLTPSRCPTPRPKPSPVPSSSRHYAADALPLPRQGKLPHHHPSVLPRVPDMGPPLFSTPIGPYHTPPPSTMPTLARDTDNSFAPTKLPGGHTGTISTTARCGASRPCRFAEERRACKASAKSPLWKKNISLSLPLAYILSYHRPYPSSLSSFVHLRGAPFPLPLPIPSRCVPRPSLVSLLSFLLLLSRIFFFRAFCHSVSVRPVAGTNNAT